MKNLPTPDVDETPVRGVRPDLVGLLMLSAWCGLAAGELEVAARVGYRAIGPGNRLYFMTRHFVWVVPLIEGSVFLTIGVVLAMAARRWPGGAGWLGRRLLLGLMIAPAMAVAGRGLYLESRLIFAIGFGAMAARVLERRSARARPWLGWTAAAMLGLVAIQAAGTIGAEPIRRWRERHRPLPPTGSPDILLIVLDTVRADHLSLYGYDRPTTPNLERLAWRGIRFDEARAPAPWTLASHASFFSGRWPHELGVRWLAPMPAGFPTLAEYLGRRGYTTAGFVSNAGYCSYDTGLDRGFAHFEDYIFRRGGTLRTAVLVDAAVKGLLDWTAPLDRTPLGGPREAVGSWFFSDERKSAARINRDFLAWLDRREEPGRPCFVFLNYLDTHTPYLLPTGARHRFGADPKGRGRLHDLLSEWSVLDKQRLPPLYSKLAGDAYDDCLSYLDEQVGALFDELGRRGVLDRMLVVVTSDHGEGLGEHRLYMHGESLYRTETRVPLLIVPPTGRAAGVVVDRPVSLRNIPATIVDLAGLAAGSPFPGRSLARTWSGGVDGASTADPDAVLSELDSPNPSNPNHGRAPTYRGPLASMAEGELVYIRNEGDGVEELYRDRDDPDERRDLAGDPAMAPVLARFRDRLRRARAPADEPGAAPARLAVGPDSP